jgi:hypothetical protein
VPALRSAKDADARHRENRNNPQFFRWPLDTATVLRVFLKTVLLQPGRFRRKGGLRGRLKVTKASPTICAAAIQKTGTFRFVD